MTESHISLTQAEWSVMECLWEAGPLTGRKVTQHMEQQNGWSRSTTLTLLSRLEHKGAIESVTTGSGPKIFSPLLGREDAALRETARLTDQRITLDEYEQAALDETLQAVRDALTKKEHPTVEVCYFVPDTRKAGGAYCTVTGVVKKMAEFEGLLILADGTEVPMGEIAVLELHG